MNTRRTLKQLLAGLVLFVLMSTALACSTEPSGPRTWMDSPADGSRVPVGTTVPVLAHAYAPDGVAEVLLSVNGTAYRRNAPAQPGATFSKASLDWFPPQEGDYILQVTSFSKSGQATHAPPVTVRAVGKLTPTPVPGKPLPADSTGRDITLVPPAPGSPDLEIVAVDAVVAGFKGATPFCNTRVAYRNAGTAAVPRDFVIQFHFNGTPQIANTVAGGLPPGAAAEITFVYQFEGAPYIGINLDSTNLIAETNEANNAFAEARLCSGPTPVPGAITLTPTPTATSIVTSTPTRTPTIGIPPPAAGCSGTPNIASLSASPSTITRGQSATLSWGAVTNADNVSIEPVIGGVATPGSIAVQPTTTTTYTLIARCGANQATRQTTITVNAPAAPATNTPTRTPTTKPKDTTPPNTPGGLNPSGGKIISCSGAVNVTLSWSAVSDPSGVTYSASWSGGSSGSWSGSGNSHAISAVCNRDYSWSVRACDGAGNCSGSASATFKTQQPIY